MGYSFDDADRLDIEPRWLTLTVQHTGTHFLNLMLRDLTGLSNMGWPQTGWSKASPVGWASAHIYSPAFMAEHDAQGLEFLRRWVEGSDVPILTTERDPRYSGATATSGVNRPCYTLDEHWAAIRHQIELRRSPRWHVLRIDGPGESRAAEIQAALDHIGAAYDAGAARSWAERWPVVHSKGEREPLDVPDDILEALGYKAEVAA